MGGFESRFSICDAKGVGVLNPSFLFGEPGHMLSNHQALGIFQPQLIYLG